MIKRLLFKLWENIPKMKKDSSVQVEKDFIDNSSPVLSIILNTQEQKCSALLLYLCWWKLIISGISFLLSLWQITMNLVA